MSVAGYHHHIAFNTWMSLNAAQRETTLGLSEIYINLATDNDVSQLAKRLEKAKYKFNYKNNRLYVSNPWSNKLVFSS